LASFLRRGGHQVSIFDGTLKNATSQDFLRAVADFQPNLVGISVLTRGHNRAREMIVAIKGSFSDLPIVIGGTQVTAAPKEVLVDLGADFAIVGEGELALLDLVKALESGEPTLEKIRGPYPLIEDLDSLPFPAWDLIPPKEYRIAPILEPARAFPIAPVLTSRGCPYNCSFCASNATWQRRLRFRSVKNVIEEIKMLKNEFGVREIHFCDDNFTMNIQRAEEMCEVLIEERINLPWQCPNGVRIDRLTPPLLSKMKKAGCYSVGLGVESGNQEMLRKVNKQLDLQIVPPVLQNLKKAGIESYGFFILGLPGETKKTIRQTIDFALKYPFDRVWFNIFAPYPGSPAFAEWLGKRDFGEIDWDKHDCATAVMAGEDLSTEEIEGLQRQATLRFYLRPRTLIKVLSRLGPREITTFLMSRFFAKFFKPVFLTVHTLTRKRK
jgi:radical SAM superfamily enzyme YgiQ (UPF0313 family)